MNLKMGFLLFCVLTSCSSSKCDASSHRTLNARLIQAVAFGKDSQVMALLKKGADVNARDDEGRTALMDAAFEQDEGSPYCYPDTGRLLIQHDAHVNATDKDGNTALMWVAQVQDNDEVDAIEFAKCLIAHHARLNVVNKEHKSALQLARANGMTRLAKLLANASH